MLPQKIVLTHDQSSVETWRSRFDCTIKKINPNTSCNGNPVNLGDRSKIKMIRRAVSKQIMNFFRGDVIIHL